MPLLGYNYQSRDVKCLVSAQWKTLKKNQTTRHEIANLLKFRFITISYFNYKFIKNHREVTGFVTYSTSELQRFAMNINKQVYLQSLLETIHTYIRKGCTVPTCRSLHVKELRSPQV